jgi:hypothetical protein
MNELTKLLDALRASIAAQSALEDALVAFAERVSLQSTLDAFPADGVDAVGSDALDPCPTVEELRDMLQKASAKDQKRVREIVAEEAGGKKIVDMTNRERQLVRISLEMSGLKK